MTRFKLWMGHGTENINYLRRYLKLSQLNALSTVSSTAVEMVDRGGDERWTSSIAVFIRGTEHVKFYIGTCECHGRTLYVPTTDVEMLVKIVTLTDDTLKRLVETWYRSHLLLKPVSESGTAQNSDPYLLQSLFTCCGDGSERLLLWEMTEFKRCVRSWHRTLTIYTRTREPHVRSKQVFYCFTTIQRNVFLWYLQPCKQPLHINGKRIPF